MPKYTGKTAKDDDLGIQRRKQNFLERPKSLASQDEWITTYQTTFSGGYKLPPKKKDYHYRSPYAQQTKSAVKIKEDEEKKRRLETLQQPTIIYEPSLDGLKCICHICGSALDQSPVFVKDLPTIPRQPLPGDIAEPKVIHLRAKDWKGVPYPYPDARFEPMFPECMDGIFMPSTLDPFRYCQRKRTFPQLNRCPNLPVCQSDKEPRVSLGRTSLESKLYDRRWPIKRFANQETATRFW